MQIGEGEPRAPDKLLLSNFVNNFMQRTSPTGHLSKYEHVEYEHVYLVPQYTLHCTFGNRSAKAEEEVY